MRILALLTAYALVQHVHVQAGPSPTTLANHARNVTVIDSAVALSGVCVASSLLRDTWCNLSFTFANEHTHFYLAAHFVASIAVSRVQTQLTSQCWPRGANANANANSNADLVASGAMPPRVQWKLNCKRRCVYTLSLYHAVTSTLARKFNVQVLITPLVNCSTPNAFRCAKDECIDATLACDCRTNCLSSLDEFCACPTSNTQLVTLAEQEGKTGTRFSRPKIVSVVSLVVAGLLLASILLLHFCKRASTLPLAPSASHDGDGDGDGNRDALLSVADSPPPSYDPPTYEQAMQSERSQATGTG